jgi:hypothetical protein
MFAQLNFAPVRVLETRARRRVMRRRRLRALLLAPTRRNFLEVRHG